jgi:hypothetical protein
MSFGYSGSSGFAVFLGVGAAAPTPKNTEIPYEPLFLNPDTLYQN